MNPDALLAGVSDTPTKRIVTHLLRRGWALEALLVEEETGTRFTVPASYGDVVRLAEMLMRLRAAKALGEMYGFVVHEGSARIGGCIVHVVHFRDRYGEGYYHATVCPELTHAAFMLLRTAPHATYIV